MSGATAVLGRNLRVWRRTWHGSLFSAFVSPTLYLAAMGLGLGSLVNRGGTTAALDGLSYLGFVGPGLLAATAMQTAASDSSWPVRIGIAYEQTFDAMLATPVTVGGLLVGHLATVTVRLWLSVAAFAAVLWLFGVTGIGGAAVAVLPAVATGLAVAAPVTAFTAWAESDESLAMLFRFGIIPVFLLSGAFFPISGLPAAVRPVAMATPLWHGVELCRAAAVGTATTLPWAAHAGVLVLWTGAGATAALRLLRARLRR